MLGEAGVRLGKADSVSGKANWVIRDASGLPGLAWGYPSYLDALSAKVSISQGGRPMRKFLGEPSSRVPGRAR
jgi:hypothetical protein